MTVSVEYIPALIEYPDEEGLRLADGNYFPVATNSLPDSTVSLLSEVLGLELQVKSGEMHFYDAATRQKLLSHEEEAAARQEAEVARQEAEVARQEAEEKSQRLAAKLRELNIDPDTSND